MIQHWFREWQGAKQVSSYCLNTLRPRRNEQHFADDIFKRIFFNENVWISIKISLKFVPKGPINNIPALVQIMAWHRWGDKPLSEPMMVSLPTHICVTRPQWVNQWSPSSMMYPICVLGLNELTSRESVVVCGWSGNLILCEHYMSISHQSSNGARPSAGTMLTKAVAGISAGPGLTHCGPAQCHDIIELGQLWFR